METNGQDSATTERNEPRRGPLDALRRRLSDRQPMHRSIWSLLVAFVLTLGAILIAIEGGALLAIFGLGWAALVLGIVALAIGVGLAPRAILPISATVTALVLSAAGLTLTQQPVDRSAGLLIVRPTSVAEIDGQTFRRGAGSILLDLRALRLPETREISVRAHTDIGRVIVALPRERCVSTTVTARLEPRPRAAAQVALIGVGLRDVVDQVTLLMGPEGGWRLPAERHEFFEAPLVAYGKPQRDGRFTRNAGGSAPRLRLELRGTVASVVRDYPTYVGPLTPESEVGEQVGGAFWPRDVRLPAQPGELATANTWHHSWTDDQIDRDVPEAWAAWEASSIAAQKAQARRAAGACASPDELAEYWSLSQFGEFESTLVLDRNGIELTAGQVTAAIANAEPLFDEYFSPLSVAAAQDRARRRALPNFYVVAVNGLGRVRRYAVGHYGEYKPTTMTAANLSGAR